MLARHYTCDLEPDHDNGGIATLVLDDARFKLQMIRYAPYSIEDGQTLVGTFTVEGDRLAFTTEEFMSYTCETVRQERRERIKMNFSGQLGEPQGLPEVRTMLIDLRLRRAWTLSLLLRPVQP
jgi:hypothetical protein